MPKKSTPLKLLVHNISTEDIVVILQPLHASNNTQEIVARPRLTRINSFCKEILSKIAKGSQFKPIELPDFYNNLKPVGLKFNPPLRIGERSDFRCQRWYIFYGRYLFMSIYVCVCVFSGAQTNLHKKKTKQKKLYQTLQIHRYQLWSVKYISHVFVLSFQNG